MKNNTISIVILAFAICLGLSSCKTISYQSRGVSIVNQDIISTPTVVDIYVDLNKRIVYSDDHYVKYASSSKEHTEQLALNAARYNCIITNNIDVVVDPVYKISFKNFIELMYRHFYISNTRIHYI